MLSSSNICHITISNQGEVTDFLKDYPEYRDISKNVNISDSTDNNITVDAISCAITNVSINEVENSKNMKLDNLRHSACSAKHSGGGLTPLEMPPTAENWTSLSAASSSDSSPENCPIDMNNCNSKRAHLIGCKFPVQVMPNLYLGNAENSADLNTLKKNNIKYVLNVTPDLPNTFEKDENFKYMKIPVDDHWSENLSEYFPQAFSFIDEGRQQNVGVLVHCYAGISRSVTVIVAYLMRTLNLSMDDAYDRVKSHKPNIAPNFNFMGQLLDYEKDLYGENIPGGAESTDALPSNKAIAQHSDRASSLLSNNSETKEGVNRDENTLANADDSV